MIKTSWKKSLVIAGVLTALCASAAFAAEQTDTKPSMRERVGTILHHDEGDTYPDRPYHMERGRHWGGPMHPGPQLTEQQVKEREAKRAEWEKMTPEERQKAREEARAKWDSMSDAEKDAAREHFRSYYHAGGGHYYEGHRKYRHHKGEYRGEHRGSYGDGRTECPNSNCPW